MTRKDFIKMCGLLGVGLPIQASFTSCDAPRLSPNSDAKVIIIGAGAGGLATGYLLKQKGIDFEILEASGQHGGRMRRTTDFADFPIPLGAEWLHVERGVFDELINDPTVQVGIKTTPYNPSIDFGLFEGQQVSSEDIGFTIDQKFINATWFDFFEEYIVPSVRGHIRYNTVVDTIDYSGDEIRITAGNGTFTADRVAVSVPAKMLQNGAINFSPELPKSKSDAINEVKIWDGCKAFIEFSEKFYPTFVGFDIQPESDGQKLYYDAAYGQNSQKHVLGLFAVGTGTLPYVNLSDDALIAYMLEELDKIFDGKATQHYVKHIFQNWNAEPYINGAYIYDGESWTKVRALGKSVDGKLFFAGDAYTNGNDWSSVHAAARSAIRAVDEMTK